MTAKVIQEIVFMENTMETTIGSRLPEEAGSIYQLAEGYSVVGQKMALLLREKGFTLMDFDRLTIVLSEAVPEGAIVFSERITDKWMRYVDYGIKAASVNSMTAEGQEDALLEAAQRVLRELFVDTAEKAAILEEAVEAIKTHSEEIDIIYQAKQDKVVRVESIVTIYKDGHCRLRAKVTDLAGKLLTEQELCQGDNLQQTLQYSGTILIRKNRVVIKPINNVTTKELQPIEIPFELE